MLVGDGRSGLAAAGARAGPLRWPGAWRLCERVRQRASNVTCVGIGGPCPIRAHICDHSHSRTDSIRHRTHAHTPDTPRSVVGVGVGVSPASKPEASVKCNQCCSSKTSMTRDTGQLPGT